MCVHGSIWVRPWTLSYIPAAAQMTRSSPSDFFQRGTARPPPELQAVVTAPVETDLQTPLSMLRAATRASHDRLDRLMDLRRLGERPRYARVLQVFDGFLWSWEGAMRSAMPQARYAWLQARSRRDFLARDLRALGITPAERPLPVPSLSGAAAAWGSLYVIEGSALGGQVITRALAAQGLGPSTGAAYFHGWGPATGAMWREFRQQLEGELTTPEALRVACDSARATFDTLAALLEDAFERPAAA